MAVLLVGAGILLRNDFSHPQRTAASASAAQRRPDFGRLPMSFEPNHGQADGRVHFLAHGNGYGLYLTSTEAALVLRGGKSVVEMQFMGANSQAEIEGSDRLPGHSNYLIGNDPSRWHRNVAQFGRVAYRNLYPGIDLAFYGKQGKLEYDFDVNPGGDPRQIRLKLAGAQDLRIAENGDLVLSKQAHELRFQAPHVYQSSLGGTQDVRGSFVLASNNEVAFNVGPYDRSRTLVIDPVFVFSTFLGGGGTESCGVLVNGSQTAPVAHCPAVAVDSAGRAYVAGATTSASFSGSTPTAIGPGGTANVFVARLNSTGSALDYVTYMGGSAFQYPAGVGVDSGFNVYVAGTTTSGDFPTTAGALQATPLTAGKHAFFAQLDSSGSAELYGTYLSGNGTDTVSDLAVDSLGHGYIIGITSSTNFPDPNGPTLGALQTCPGETSSGCPTAPTNNFFFTELNPGLNGTSSLLYSTYLGGSTPVSGSVFGGAVAVDTTFHVYLAGGTSFTDMPVVNAFQTTQQGGVDLWVAKLNPPANNTQQFTAAYETFFGGAGNEVAYGVATDPTSGGNAYVTGSITSGGIITVPAVASGTIFPQNFGGGTDAFVAKFGNPTTTGTTQGTVPLSFFTYLGGGGTDTGLSITADSSGFARLTGWTSGGLPTTGSISGSGGGGADAFIARLFTSGTSTSGTGSGSTSSVNILGGGGTDIGTSVATDSALNMYVAGDTSGGFPQVNPIAGFGGGTDAFVSKLGPNTSGLSFKCTVANCPPSNPAVTPSPVNVGGQVTFKYSIYNTGDPVAGVVFTSNIATNTTFVSATASSGGQCSQASGVVTCSLGTVATSSTSSTTGLTPSATVSIVVSAPTQVLTSTLTIGNSGTLTVPNATPAFTPTTVSGSAFVNDFTISITGQDAQTVVAGAVATFTATISPVGAGGFPASVSLSCGSLPSLTSCDFGSNSSLPNLTGPRNVTFEVKTTARVTTPGSLFLPGGPTYALWFPIFGAGLMGAGITRKRRMLLGAFFAAVLAAALLQAGCGSSNSNRSTTTGTPTGTFTITVNAVAGATRTTTVQLTVE